MILSFSGDAFLAERAARRALRSRGFAAESVTELSEDLNGAKVQQLAMQSGLFGASALLLDFDSAFSGASATKARNEVIRGLEHLPPSDNLIIILDREATEARQKSYQKLGKHDHQPTPRYGALTHWVRTELEAEKLRFDKDVPECLAELFGEDLPAIAAEIQKLAVLDEVLSIPRVKNLVNRPAARDSFALIEAISEGNSAKAFDILLSLKAQDEAPMRIMGALIWQYQIVARTVALKESRGRIDASLLSQQLKLKPFVAKKSLALSQKLDEARLYKLLKALLEADSRIKQGKDDELSLESLVISLCQLA
ncbi:MAG: DNA polymerase III subunit delta [Deinococcales bacterium]